ncbi:unnamed protein product [Phytomonas sp. EM1]|nr:unnamed protein product [Phytomonas sp. EM1]|eukprot:CCW63508.1 unnamed protein product [Phytomonas sp. isolate EM1]
MGPDGGDVPDEVRIARRPHPATQFHGNRPVEGLPGLPGSLPLRLVDSTLGGEAVAVSALPLEALSRVLSGRHRARCRRLGYVWNLQKQRRRGEGWWEQHLPVFATADAAPQVMDLDLRQTASRVARRTHDSGVVVI